MRKVILNCKWALGDVVLLTAAVRDLHKNYPGEFLTDVRCYHPEVWRHNPYIVRLEAEAGDVELVDCKYPLINRSNQTPHHCIHGFRRFLNKQLGIQIEPSVFKGDIHLSQRERAIPSQIKNLIGDDISYWVVSAGGKYDLTIKWWSSERYQEVVDGFEGKIQFVQVGAKWDWHPKLSGAIDLRGCTDTRQLIRLIYHSQGVLCGVTGAMHLAAAVETIPERPNRRPCVVVAGGREPVHWEAYPEHQFIHTLGALECCSGGGCWKSRTVALGDGHERDHPDKRCVDVVDDLPRCMHMITAAEVVRKVESYFENPAYSYLTLQEAEAGARGVAKTSENSFDDLPLHRRNALLSTQRFLKLLPGYREGCTEKGIVMSAGGPRYSMNAWVCINRIRQLGSTLPIELWSLNSDELDDSFKQLLSTKNVHVIDASQVRKANPIRNLDGASLKPYAILHSRFRRILWLDADNVPVIDPDDLFASPQFREAGAAFWPDPRGRRISDETLCALGIFAGHHDAILDTGQLLLDKKRCWKALNLALWYHAHSEYFAGIVECDRMIQLAFWKTSTGFVFPKTPSTSLDGATCHFDFAGNLVFQHRNDRKWEYRRPNKPIEGFRDEGACLQIASDLLRKWKGRRADTGMPRASEESACFWHVFADHELKDGASKRRMRLAAASWADQYRRADWRTLPVKITALPRVFRDRGRRCFYLADIVGEAIIRARPEDIIVLTKSESCAASSLTRRLSESVRTAEACYSYEREFKSFKKEPSDEDLERAELLATCGLFAFSVSWWKINSERVEDFLLEGSFWSHCLRIHIRETVASHARCLDNLVYCDKLRTQNGIESGGEEQERLSEAYNRTLAEKQFGSEFLEPIRSFRSVLQSSQLNDHDHAERDRPGPGYGSNSGLEPNAPLLDVPDRDLRLDEGVDQVPGNNTLSHISDRIASMTTRSNARELAEAFIAKILPCKRRFTDRGITICAGGVRYFPRAWVVVRMLRRLGCELPIELWHLGGGELDRTMKELVSPFDVECIDAYAVREQHPARILNGWEVKPYSIIHSRFKEVLSLDADVLPLRKPDYLFDEPSYVREGAVFWPGLGNLDPSSEARKIIGVEICDEPELDVSLILANKEKCWRELQLTMFYNEHSDFYYHVVSGNRETFHMAWRKIGGNYTMPKKRPVEIPMGVRFQHDLSGRPVFQYRTREKWCWRGQNSRILGFEFQDECYGYLAELEARWDGAIVRNKPGLPRILVKEGNQARKCW